VTKHDDDAASKATKRIETEPLPGVRVGINVPVPEPAKRLYKVPGRVSFRDMAVITRAVTLHLARSADLDDDSPEKTGKAIAEICGAYLTSERSTRHASESPSGA
jgi:hypothetical protein